MLEDRSLGGGLVFLNLIGFLEAAGWAAFLIYFPIYLESIGISYFQIGVIAAAPTIVGMFTGVIWSSCSDHIGRRRPFMIQSALSASLFTFLVTLISSFEWFLILGILRGLLTPMLEGLTIASLFSLFDQRKMGRAFGGYAMWKSIGWAASTMVAGALSQLLGLKAALQLSSLMFLMIAVVALRISENKRAAIPRGSRTLINTQLLKAVLDSLREPKMLTFLLASLPLYLAISGAMTFFPVYLKTTGAAPLLVGAIFTVPVFFEALIFSRIGKIADDAGGKRRLLLLSSAAYFLLILFIGILQDPLLLFLAYSMLDPLAWPPLFTASSALISQILPPQKWAIGQTLYRAWAWSFSSVLGSLIGGWVSEILGMPAMFTIMSILAASSWILFTRVEGV